jgi:hypothetical protein
MVALGEPHAQSLSPEALAAIRGARTHAARHHESDVLPPEPQSRRHLVGRVLLMAVGAVELCFILTQIAPSRDFPFVLLAFSLGTTFLPALLAPSRKVVASRVRHFFYLGLVLLPCPQLTLGAFAFFMLRSTRPTAADYLYLFGPLALAAARLVAVGFLYTRPRN